MSVSSVSEVWQERDGKFSRSGTEAELRRQYRILTSDTTDDAATIFASGQIPLKGERHPHYPNAFADEFDFQPQPFSPKVWLLTVTYKSTNASAELPQAKELQPTLREAQISWGYVQFRKPLLKAIKKQADGSFGSDPEAVTNSADVPFNPPPEVDDSRPQVTVTKNMLNVPAFVLAYQDAVNSDTFSVDGISVQPGLAKMQGVGVGPWQFENNELFRSVTMTIQFQREGWDLDLLDRGYEESVAKQGGGFLLRKLVDDEGNPLTEPGLLDGHGKKKADSDPVSYVTYRPYQRLPFSSLPLR